MRFALNGRPCRRCLRRLKLRFFPEGELEISLACIRSAADSKVVSTAGTSRRHWWCPVRSRDCWPPANHRSILRGNGGHDHGPVPVAQGHCYGPPAATASRASIGEASVGEPPRANRKNSAVGVSFKKRT